MANPAPSRNLADADACLVLGGIFLLVLAACGAAVDLGALVAPGLAEAVFAPLAAGLGRTVARVRWRGVSPYPG